MRKSLLPIILILSLISCCIEVEVSIPGFPSMAKYFSVSESAIQLTIAFNLLGFCLASIIYGPLSESFGRRKVMLAGNFIMLIGASACVFAPTIYSLYAARFIQGIGAATSAVVIFVMVSDIYSGEESIKILGLFNAVFTAFMAIAPIIGGFINQAVSWRGNYALIAITTCIAWLTLLLFLPETNKNHKPFQIKLMIADYCKLLSSKNFLSASIVPSLLYAGYIVFVACSSFLYINTFQMPMIEYAMSLAIIIGIFAITSVYASKITKTLGNEMSIVSSLIVVVTGIVIMFITSHTLTNKSFLITFSMCLYCFGFAILYPIIFSQSLEIFPEIKGTASSAIMSMRTLLMAALIAFGGFIYNGTATSIALILALNITIIVVLTGYLLINKGQI